MQLHSLILFTAMIVAGLGMAQAPQKFTPEQQKMLKERDAMVRQAKSLQAAGKIKEALALVEKILKSERALVGDQHDAVRATILWMARLHEDDFNFAAAKESWSLLVDLSTKQLGKEHWRTIDARLAFEKAECIAGFDDGKLAEYKDLILLVRQQGKLLKETKFAAAFEVGSRMLEKQKALFGVKGRDYAMMLVLQGRLNSIMRKLEACEPFYQNALRIYRDVLGVHHPDYATCLTSLAELYQEQSDYRRAEPLCVQSLAILAASTGDNSAEYAVCLNRLASLYTSQGKYLQAEKTYSSVLRIRRDKFGIMSSEYSTSLMELASVCAYQKQDSRAESLYRESLRIGKALLEVKPGDKDYSLFYSKTLRWLGGFYENRALYAKAEPLLLECLRLRKDAAGEMSIIYADSMHDMVEFYAKQGQYAKAEFYCHQALWVYQVSVGLKHRNYVDAQISMGNLYWRQGRYADAEGIFRRSLDFYKSNFADDKLHCAMISESLGVIYSDRKLYSKAEPLLKDTNRILRELCGEKHPLYATSLNNLGMLYCKIGKYALAEPLLKESLQIDREAYGTKHPQYAARLFNLANLYGVQQQSAKASPLFREALQIMQNHLEATATVQSESEQLHYLAVTQGYLNNYIEYSTEVEPLYDAVFRWHGAVTARQAFATAASRSSPQALQFIRELQDQTRQMNHLAQNPPKGISKYDQIRALEEFDAQREMLGKKIASLSRDFAAYQSHRKLTPADLQKSLPEDAALLDYFVHGDKISVFIVTRKAISRVILEGGQELKDDIEAFISEGSLMRTRPVTDDGDLSLKVRERIWTPLEPHLQNIRQVLICPDGPLCRLPFGILPGKDRKNYLIEELQIILAPVPQMLPELLAASPAKGDPSLLAVGDVDFDGDPAAGEVRKVAPVAMKRGDGLNWTALPQSRGEIDEIEKLFRKLPRATVMKLAENQPTEAALEREITRHRFIHLATHGFFQVPKMIRILEDNSMIGRQNITIPSIPPGLCSGIVCAGANKPTLQDSGIMTALQIAELDLRNVELVVLSACETGLGKLADGEGVLGLQRAFQMAGARSTVSSLWSVPDQSTAELMKRFYANRLEKGLATAEALREAQLWVLNNGDKVGAFAELKPGKRTPPLYWAAFTLAGDWR